MSTEDHPDWWRPVGGQNSQDSILERRSLVWNDGDPVAPAAPPMIESGPDLRGKFFTRGCRGMIESLQIYCVRTAAGTLDLSFSPHPGLGPLYVLTVTPGAAWDWATVDFRQMWNYDSLFIWVSRWDADVSWGSDGVQPYDLHSSMNLGATWILVDVRLYVRVIYSGETPGDVPVSGIINTIKIPSTGEAVAAEDNVNVPNNALITLVTFWGAGFLIQATVRIDDNNLVVPTNPYGGVIYQMQIWADFAPAFVVDNRDLTQSDVATSGRSSCGEFLLELAPTSGVKWLVMNLRIPFEFRRNITIAFYHRAGNPLSVDGRIYANVMR
jgi:hypothetical protein